MLVPPCTTAPAGVEASNLHFHPASSINTAKRKSAGLGPVHAFKQLDGARVVCGSCCPLVITRRSPVPDLDDRRRCPSGRAKHEQRRKLEPQGVQPMNTQRVAVSLLISMLDVAVWHMESFDVCPAIKVSDRPSNTQGFGSW